MTAPTTSAGRYRPILFSGEMVRAIPDGRKTQTRRLNGLEEINHRSDEWTLHQVGTLDYMTRKPFRGRFGAYFHSETIEPGALSIAPVVCPYGRPGDRLYVREAWHCPKQIGGTFQREKLLHREHFEACGYSNPPKWSPSIHMPRWASRITLEITGVRVERINEITPMDAVAEGVGAEWDEVHEGNGPRDRFRDLWDSINAARGYGWDANPWVWCISFRRIAEAAHV